MPLRPEGGSEAAKALTFNILVPFIEELVLGLGAVDGDLLLHLEDLGLGILQDLPALHLRFLSGRGDLGGDGLGVLIVGHLHLTDGKDGGET